MTEVVENVANTTETIWKQYGNHHISNMGEVKRVFLDGSERIVRGCVDKAGYKFFQVHRDGKIKNIFFHRIVAELFLGVRPAGLVTDHINRNNKDNRVCNLRYVTPQENARNSDRFKSEITLEGRARYNYLAREARHRRGDEYRQYQREYKKRRRQMLELQNSQNVENVEN